MLKGERDLSLPQLTFKLREDQLRIRNIFKFGQQGEIFRHVVDTLIKLHDEYGDMAIAAIQAGDVSIIDMLKKTQDKD